MSALKQKLTAIARQEVDDIRDGLPTELRERAAAVAVRYEMLPADSPFAENLGDDLLGLFVGPEFSEQAGTGILSPQIILFLESLWDFSAGDETLFRAEVRKTYLHELGHYLGLDEEDVEDRGL